MRGISLGDNVFPRFGIVRWARIRSPWIIHFNSGACNACDIEVVALLTPRYDLERFGVLNNASPRQADILVATGPATRQAAPRLRRIYEQMPEPKYVIAVGTCACSGASFKKCYNVLKRVDKVIPVDMYVPGCPPKPEAILYGITKLLDTIGKDD
ncbi:MAG: NADH-quinone oxidoreductase subunit B family protein [Thermoproteota archaeon]